MRRISRWFSVLSFALLAIAAVFWFRSYFHPEEFCFDIHRVSPTLIDQHYEFTFAGSHGKAQFLWRHFSEFHYPSDALKTDLFGKFHHTPPAGALGHANAWWNRLGFWASGEYKTFPNGTFSSLHGFSLPFFFCAFLLALGPAREVARYRRRTHGGASLDLARHVRNFILAVSIGLTCICVAIWIDSCFHFRQFQAQWFGGPGPDVQIACDRGHFTCRVQTDIEDRFFFQRGNFWDWSLTTQKHQPENQVVSLLNSDMGSTGDSPTFFSRHGFHFQSGTISSSIFMPGGQSYIWAVYFRLWFLACMGLMPVGVIFLLRFRPSRLRAYRLAHGLCTGCGYDLRATPERCPECGLDVPRRAVAPDKSGG